MRRSYNSSTQTSEVDMTPMLDVVFIMLIFFIVSTSFIKESGLELNRPSANNEGGENSQTVLISIGSGNNISIDAGNSSRVIDTNAIRANIERFKAANPDTTIIIKAHDASSAQMLVKVIDAVKASGIEKNKISISNYKSKN